MLCLDINDLFMKETKFNTQKIFFYIYDILNTCMAQINNLDFN